jgi:hypothetical protein
MWRPPDDPDPHEILHEAVADGRNGHPEIALAKFLWFHENATSYEPSLSAVRVSFALGYWMDLASSYRPALDAFVRVRDETESAFRKNWTDFNRFKDVASMNARLGERERTATLFLAVASQDHGAAADLYRVAERHLISAGAYRACAPFLEVDKRIARAAEHYLWQRQYEASRPPCKFPPPSVARDLYIKDVATLVALLALNDRMHEARDAHQMSLLVLDDEDFRSILDAAVTGHFPAGL